MKPFIRGFVIVAIVFRLAGCGGDDLVELEVDAAAAELDAGGACIPDEQRSEECKVICAVPEMRCPGALGGECYDECRALSSGTAYCPP